MSMFREHWIGGLVAYSTFFIVSLIATIAVPIFYDGVPQAWNPTIPPVSDPHQKSSAVLLLLCCSDCRPDVDIKSKSQKIFYRVLFVLNVVLDCFLAEVSRICAVGAIRDAPDYE